MSKKYYCENAGALIEQYNSLDPTEVHSAWLKYLPSEPGMALDVGAGSGRDANWLAELGWDVIAAEPEEAMRKLASGDSHPNVRWLDDSMPDLRKIRAAGHRFNLILLSAVWMHVPVNQRQRAFRVISELLAPNGILVITLRHSSDDAENQTRGFLPVSQEELQSLAKGRALASLEASSTQDRLGRSAVHWETVVFRLPDDGTGSLPLLRHVIVNDDKSATYKLGLLRALIRIAEGAPGMVTKRDDHSVEIPFGLVGLYWLKLYMPLVLQHNLIQTPKADHVAEKGYGWANQNFWALRSFSANDLRIGSAFVGPDAKLIIGAINRACRNIQEMPANFIKWPGTDRPVFQCEHRSRRPTTNFFIDREHLLQFGTFSIPADLWQCMGQFACWLEPAVVNEWIGLLDRYNQRYEKQTYAEAMKWSEGIRDTRLARDCASDLRVTRLAQGDSLNCVWSNRKLADEFEIDHCFPWSRWFNNDLWNLMPASRTVNNAKREKLPSAEIMHRSKGRILDWWEAGYCSGDYKERFFTEAEAALPLVDRQAFSLDSVFEAAMHQRARLKANQQLVEWTLKQ